jgi:hypothetical protein
MSLPWAWVEERLRTTHNYWLAVNRPGQAPYLRPVWCVWTGDALVFTSSPASLKAQMFVADPNVSIHLELDREVVVVEGAVEQATEPAGYADKYGWTPPPAQSWYLVRARKVYAADEATYPASATTYDR